MVRYSRLRHFGHLLQARDFPLAPLGSECLVRQKALEMPEEDLAKEELGAQRYRSLLAALVILAWACLKIGGPF